jgi:hypothetical protein
MWAFRVRLERLSGEIFPYFRFMRSICPWKPEYGRSFFLSVSTIANLQQTKQAKQNKQNKQNTTNK